MAEDAWNFWIGRRGTFTRVAGLPPVGRLHPFTVLARRQGMLNSLTSAEAACPCHATIRPGSPAGRLHGGRPSDGACGLRVRRKDSRTTGSEVVEMRFPVLEGRRLRPDCGGRGLGAAGDDAERRIRVCVAMDCAILSSHCALPPRRRNGQTGVLCAGHGDGSTEAPAACVRTVTLQGAVALPHPPSAGGRADAERP